MLGLLLADDVVGEQDVVGRVEHGPDDAVTVRLDGVGAGKLAMEQQPGGFLEARVAREVGTEGRLGGQALVAIVFAFGFLPQVVLFVGQMLVSDAALDYLTDNAAVLWQVPVAVAVLGVLGSLKALLTGKRYA